ncbi:unnamed protein product [Paramecium octaurelia]|uniref:Uncharacterized protein n=1 Tax=Paramecium octaurelia TaxID=43137 RepID=A0A8S1V021_PAROT|nr:unnamed protein product [Paramecium octaurelia]
MTALKFTGKIQGKVVQYLLDSICYSGQACSEKNFLFTKLSDHARISCQLNLLGVQNQKEHRISWSMMNAYNLNQEAALKCKIQSKKATSNQKDYLFELKENERLNYEIAYIFQSTKLHVGLPKYKKNGNSSFFKKGSWHLQMLQA